MAVIVGASTRNSPWGYSAIGGAMQVVKSDNLGFLSAVLQSDKLHYRSRSLVSRAKDYCLSDSCQDVSNVSLGLQSIHQAFAAHLSISLRPDTLWYFIIHEVAAYICQNRLLCKGLLDIKANDLVLWGSDFADWSQVINQIYSVMSDLVDKDQIQLFRANFSTSGAEDCLAQLAVFMNSAASFSPFSLSANCGIPQFRLEGSAADWALLYRKTENLAAAFTGLERYFADLLPVLQEIGRTASGAKPDGKFWSEIYRCGKDCGPTAINGWITAFFAYIQTADGPVIKDNFDWRAAEKIGFNSSQFPAHISQISFFLSQAGRRQELTLASGIIGVDYDGFLTPRLGFAIAEA